MSAFRSKRIMGSVRWEVNEEGKGGGQIGSWRSGVAGRQEEEAQSGICL